MKDLFHFCHFIFGISEVIFILFFITTKQISRFFIKKVKMHYAFITIVLNENPNRRLSRQLILPRNYRHFFLCSYEHLGRYGKSYWVDVMELAAFTKAGKYKLCIHIIVSIPIGISHKAIFRLNTTCIPKIDIILTQTNRIIILKHSFSLL